MKVRITTQGKSLAVDMSQEDADAMFKLFAFRMLGVFDEKNLSSNHVIKPKCKSEVPHISEKSKEMQPQNDSSARRGYKGFLYIKCQKCGEIKGFCSKEEMFKYRCSSCGEATEFEEDLKLLYVNCQCGKGFKYLTNMKESMFDINCIDCGSPVAVEWNDKQKLYQTIH